MAPVDEQTVGGLSLEELHAEIEGALEGQPMNKLAGLPEAIAAAAPPGSTRLSPNPAGENGWVPVTDSPVAKADHPQLDKVYAALGYPWGSTGTDFNLPPIAGTEPDASLFWVVKT